jgi:hypothetical protein
MLLKDYRKRPSASKLKTLLMKSEYYDKLYSSPKSRNTRLEIIKRSSNSSNSNKSDKSDKLDELNNFNNSNNGKKDSGKLLDICLTDAHGDEYRIPRLDIGDTDNDIV